MKPKTHEFKGKKVIAVPETNGCIGCAFNTRWDSCEMWDEFMSAPRRQKKLNMPDCFDSEIIFQLAPDENIAR